MLLKVVDNFVVEIVGNYGTADTAITLSDAPSGITQGYLTVFDEEGRQYEKIKFTGVAGNVFTAVRGLSFDTNSDTPVTGNAKDLKSGMKVKLSVSQHYINAIIDVLNGVANMGGVPKNPSSRSISDPRHLIDKEYADAIATAGVTILQVTDNGGVTVNINAGYYILNGNVTYYAGASNQALTDDAVNYIEINDGVLSINTTAFSEDAMPLAKVTCASGDITILEDARALLSWSDIKANYGIARDGYGVYIDLDTDPGLEFNSGKLRAKIKSASGITRDSNGLSVNPNELGYFTKLTKNFVAGENISAGQAVIISGMDDNNGASYNGSNDNSETLNDTVYAGQVFKTSANAKYINAVILRVNNNYDDLVPFSVSIRAISGGVPTGADIGGEIATVATQGPISNSDVTFRFSNPIPVSPSTYYAIVVKIAYEPGNSASVVYDNTAPGYADGSFVKSTNNGSTWTSDSGKDCSFTILESFVDPEKIYKADASVNDQYAKNFIGIMAEAANAGETKAVIISGIADTLSGLTPGRLYYLSDTSGALSLSAGSTSVLVGVSISETELKLK